MKQFLFSFLLLLGTFSQFSAAGHSCLACPVPSGLSVSAANGSQASLAWDAVAGVTTYTVEVESTGSNNTPFNVETNVNGTTYTITGLLANQSYKFKVRARCSGDNSDWADWVFFNSTSGSGTGGGGGSGAACAIPTGLAATSTATGMSLSWTAVPGVTTYTVEVENENPNTTPYHIEVNVTGTTYAPTGLLANQKYKFKVRSKCGSDHSDWSTALQFISGTSSGGGTGGGGTGTTCAIPTGLAATSTATGMSLSWTAVSGVTTYTVEVENENPNTTPYHIEVGVTGTTYMPTGLLANQKYKFKVRSKCGGDHSDWSTALQFISGTGSGGGMGSACAIPASLSVAMASGSATLSWGAVAGAASYSIEVENASGNNQFYSFTTTTANATFLLTGLATNLNYKFKVRANCNSAHSDWSPWLVFNSTSGTGSNSGPCSTPTGLAASVANSIVTLSWNAVSGALSYTIEVENSFGNNSLFHVETTVVGGTYQPTGLVANRNYKFKVRANCASGKSAWSNWQVFNSASGSINSTGFCTAPGGLTAVINGSSAVLSWTAVSGAISYRIEVEDGDNTPAFNLAVNVTGTTYTVTGLTVGGNYKFKVRSNCSFLTSSWSSWFFFGGSGTGGGGNGGGTCGIASGLGANALTTSAVLTWSAVPGAVSYGIELEDASGNSPFIFQSATVVGLTYTANGLMAGVAYKFKVRANCASGHGDWSSFFTFQTAHLRPGGIDDRGDETTNKHFNTEGPLLSVAVWPVPLQQELNLRLTGLSAAATHVRLFNLTGQLAAAFSFESGAETWEQTLELPTLIQGVYLLQVENNGRSQFVKVVRAER